jgi:hypothetical protein
MSAIQVRQNNTNEPLVMDSDAKVIYPITIAASQGALVAGAVLGEISGTPGTYKLVDKEATDGTQIPSLILATEAVANSVSTTTLQSGYSAGLFDSEQLSFAAGTDIDDTPGEELMPNLVDRDFSAATAWADVDLAGGFDETGDLTIAAGTAAQYCTLLVASAPTVVGAKYNLFFDLSALTEEWIFQDFTGAQVLAQVAAAGTQISISWTALLTGGFRIVANHATSDGTFDNFSLKLDQLYGNMSMKTIMRIFNLRTAPGLSVSGYENPVL